MEYSVEYRRSVKSGRLTWGSFIFLTVRVPAPNVETAMSRAYPILESEVGTEIASKYELIDVSREKV